MDKELLTQEERVALTSPSIWNYDIAQKSQIYSKAFIAEFISVCEEIDADPKWSLLLGNSIYNHVINQYWKQGKTSNVLKQINIWTENGEWTVRYRVDKDTIELEPIMIKQH